MRAPRRKSPDKMNPVPEHGRDEAARAAGVSRRELFHGTALAAAGAVMMRRTDHGMPAVGGSADASAEPMTLVVEAGANGRTIPRDFAGLSFERGALNSGNADV